MRAHLAVLLCVLSLQLPAYALEFSLASPTWTAAYKSPRDTWSGLRILPYFGTSYASGNETHLLKTDIVPIVVRWFEHVLKVPKLDVNLKVPIPYCGPADVPLEHQNVGVDADAILYIVTASFRIHPYDKFSYGSACLLNVVAPYRVLAGTVWVQMDWFNGLSHNKKVDVVAKHFAQALGFDSLLFEHYTKPDGNRYEENELHGAVKMAGALRHVLTLPTVLEKARIAFDCPSLAGVRLSGDETDDNRFNFYQDNYGYYQQNFTNYLTLWSARMMLNDFMSDLIVSDRSEYSSVTMAVFQDSGWYEVNWDYTSAPRFAYKRGCTFFEVQCLKGRTPTSDEFCAPDQYSCSSDFTSKGYCSLTRYGALIPDQFRYIDDHTGGHAAVDYCAVMKGGETCLEGVSDVAWEEKCSDCRCFEGEYFPENNSTAKRNTHCHRVTCDQGKAVIKINSELVECPPEGGNVTIRGFTGSLVCPSADRICKPPPCKSLCSGRGKCMNGVCICESGFYGEDCALACDQSCLTCVAGSQVTCVTCRAGAHLKDGKCLCEDQFTMNSQGECVSQVACHPTCLSCFATSANSCWTCHSPATLSSTNSCECPFGSTMNSVGACVSCRNGCAKCTFPNLSICLSARKLAAECAAGQYLNLESSQCERCFPPCLSCSGRAIDCLSCIDKFILNGSVCECPIEWYLKDGECKRCHSSCLTCTGDKEWECTSCRADSLLKTNPGHCICRSSDSSNCFPCDAECLTCSEVDPFQCKTCKDNASLDSQSSRCRCNDGFFFNQTTYQCDPCHHSCATCFGPTPDNCNSCISDYDYLDGHVCLCKGRRYLSLSDLQCKDCVPHCASCISSTCDYCDDGFLINDIGLCELIEGFFYDEEDGNVYPCPQYCSRCNYTVKPEMKCEKCIGTLSMNSTTTACYCPINTSLYIDDRRCYLCNDAKCAKCADNNIGYCETCMEPYSRTQWYGACACAAGTYEANNACLPCASSCPICTGPTPSECTWCPDGSYLNNTSETPCIPCGQDCRTCTGPTSSECKSCPSRFYMNNTSCIPCHPWCGECNGPNDDNCLTCWHYSSFEPGIPGKCFCNFRVSQTTCHHLDSRDKCHPYCLECNGPSYRQCIACNSTISVLKQYAGGAACECLPDHRNSGTCWPCDYQCDTCNDQGKCKTCQRWTRMSTTDPGTCLCTNRDDHSYPSPDIFHCPPCHFKCQACTGPYENNCTSCIAGVDLQSDNTCKCRGMGAMMPDRWCFTRDFFCLDGYCNFCRGLARRVDYPSGGRWLSSCRCPAQNNLGTGLYSDTMAGICHKCGPLCLNCARDTRMCWSCKLHSHLSYISPLGAPGFCECDEGYFVSYEYEECSKCPPGCTSCKSDTVCTGCEYGYELSVFEGEAHCDCFSPLCKCAVGLSAVPPFDNCEERCPAGFRLHDRKCIATGSTKFVFTPTSIVSEIMDRSGLLLASFGDPNVAEAERDQRSPIPIYKNGLLFKAGKSAYITITRIGEDLILGPIHYIELWQKGSTLLSIKRGGDNPTFQYDSKNILIKLSTKTNSRSFPHSVQNITVATWTLIRYEVQAYKYRLGTRIRMHRDNKQTFEQIIDGYFYRDDAFDGLNTDITLWTDAELLLGDFVIANRLWAEESIPACGCAHCTAAGSCLSDCGAMEYMKADLTCGQCGASCTLGCVRGNDCSRNLDPLCDDYSNFTECEGCKEQLTTLSDGVCGCKKFSTFRENNNTCTCNVHYKLEENSCKFVPDPLCGSYISQPDCESCVPQAVLVGDYCECIPHSTFSEASKSCKCDPHYMLVGGKCVFDPLCETTSKEGECPACKKQASFKGNFCQCVENASQSEDSLSCTCNEDFKPFESICIPKYDPLCAKEVDGYCSECKEMAFSRDGVCVCKGPTHFDSLTESCVCGDWLAIRGESCVYSPDALCAHLSSDGTCLACKGLATLVGDSCDCVVNATLSEDGFSCQCNSGLKPYGNLCIEANDPRCVKYYGYHCDRCSLLSRLVDGLCQCVEHASLSGEKCVCDPLYAEYKGECVDSSDRLCAKFSASETCSECRPQATLKDGKCECVEHSSLDEGGNTCTCAPPYIASGTSCDFYQDLLCETFFESQKCEKCKPRGSLQNGWCVCIDHASTWQDQDQCDCDFQYEYESEECRYNAEPLCLSVNKKGECGECKLLADLDNGKCTCGKNADLALDGLSCSCSSGFKLHKTKCIPKNDPMCTNLKNDECQSCLELSTPIDGVCTCVLHAKLSSTSCTCEPHYASFNSKCVYSEDPLCGELDTKGKCVGCKPPAVLQSGGDCGCGKHATYNKLAFSCECERRFLSTRDGCVLDRDPRCAQYTDNEDCERCEDLSELRDDLCQCVEHAHEAQSGACVCDTHYISDLTGNKCNFDTDKLCLVYTSECVSCTPHSTRLEDAYCHCDEGYEPNTETSTCELFDTFLLPSDVKVELSVDFSQILVTFSGAVRALSTCKSIFAGAAYSKLGSKPSCQWNTDRTVLSITLDRDATVVEEDLELSSATVVQSQRPKGFQPPNFTKRVKYRGEKILPTATLKAPSTVYLECPNAVVLLDAKGSYGGMGVPLQYRWIIKHSSVSNLYDGYNKYSSTSFINLSTKDLQAGSLNVTVVVKDRLGQENSTSSAVNLTKDTSLEVDLDVGNSLTLTSDSQASVRAVVGSSCGQIGQRTYTWSYIEATQPQTFAEKSPKDVLPVGKMSATLMIGRGALAPGFTYTYQVSVTQGLLSGSAQVEVKVLVSDLQVRLSRASGSHPADVKFVLSAASSRDPDNMPGTIAYKWQCHENDQECRDKFGASILNETTQADIEIEESKLKVGALLKFNVTISKDSRSSSATAEFAITQSSGIAVILPPFYQKVLRHLYFAVAPKIETRYQTFFKWQESETATVIPDSPVDASYLAFFAYKLQPETHYIFEMTASTVIGTMKQQASFTVISEPLPGNTTAEPESGRGVLDLFTLSTGEWTDPGGNYPLTYQFCAELLQSNEVCFGSPQLTSWRKTKLAAGSYTIRAKVYNSLGGFGQQSSPNVTVTKVDFRRHLLEMSIQESFLSDIEDPEATLGMIAVYCQSLPLDDQFFSFLITTLTGYMDSLFEVNLQSFETFLGAVGSMTMQQASRLPASAGKLAALANATLERYTAELSETQLDRVLSLAVALNATGASESLRTSALAQFYRNRLPSASPYTFTSSSLKFAILRQVVQSFSDQQLAIGSVSIKLPNLWLNNTNLTASDVVDLRLAVLPESSPLAVKVELAKSGEYQNYNVQLLQQAVPVSLFNVTEAFSISWPYSNVNATEVECVGLDEGGQWSPELCTIVGTADGVVTVSARSCTTYTLRPVAHTPDPVEEPISLLRPEEEEDESINPTPSVLAAAVLVAGLAAIAYAKSRSIKSASNPTAEEVRTSEPEICSARSNEPEIICSLPPLESSTPKFKPPPSPSFWKFHALIHATQDRSAPSIVPLAFLLMTEAVALGLCYTFWNDGDKSASNAEEVFRSYSRLDLVYAAIAVAAGTTAHGLCSLLLSVLGGFGMILSEIAVLLEFGGVVTMNAFLAFGPGGRWGEGTLWTFLIQLLIVETAKTALISATRRTSTRLAPATPVSPSAENE